MEGRGKITLRVKFEMKLVGCFLPVLKSPAGRGFHMGKASWDQSVTEEVSAVVRRLAGPFRLFKKMENAMCATASVGAVSGPADFACFRSMGRNGM